VTTAGTDDAAIDLRGVWKSYRSPAGRVRVLDDLDLSIAPGEVVALAGRSGSGKTTLLTIVAGWDEPDAGTTTVLGAEAARPHAWRDMAVLPQSLGLLDELTIAENVTLPIRLGRARHALDPDTMMTRLGIHHLARRYPRDVSLGEQQRAALARAVVLRPRLLIADEPIAHQNQGWAEGMMLVVGELAAQGSCCLIATHNEVAFSSAHRVLELHGGRLRPLTQFGVGPPRV
jgi:putative ABC transport system ATP-binding protein